MAFALVSGQLFKAPEIKTGKSGKPFTVATLKARDGDGFAFWGLTAFSEGAQAELCGLSEGDAITAQGAMRAELWKPESGEPRIKVSLIAESVLALRQPKKAKPETCKKAAASASKAPCLARAMGDGVDVFGDEIGL